MAPRGEGDDLAVAGRYGQHGEPRRTRGQTEQDRKSGDRADHRAPGGRAGELDLLEGYRRDGEHRQGVVDGIVAGHHQKPGDQLVQMVAEQS